MSLIEEHKYEEQNSFSPEKWYDNKLKLGLSILFFPLFLYGLWDTKLVKKEVKNFIFGGFFILMIAIKFGGKGSGSGKVRQSPWDNSVNCVESYLKNRYLNDPSSYESVKWGKVEENADGTYSVTHTFRARNAFGGMLQVTKTFVIASDGWTILNTY